MSQLIHDALEPDADDIRQFLLAGRPVTARDDDEWKSVAWDIAGYLRHLQQKHANQRPSSEAENAG